MPKSIQQTAELDAEIDLLIKAIFNKYSYDFREYTFASQKRRIMQAVTSLKCENVTALMDKVLLEPDMFMQLLQYLTIPVSEMFRDPSYYAALREHVIPILKTYPSLKIWVAGCSTGEEIYSLAILLEEEGLLDKSIIYATDINPVSLEKAKKGIFPISRMASYTENYQQSGGKKSFSGYYTAAYDGAMFDQALSRNVTFADHSLATDHVFSEVHLISCRNVMIYFNSALQSRVLDLFHDALCHKGFLGLGSKESLDYSTHADRFSPLAKKERVFRKIA